MPTTIQVSRIFPLSAFHVRVRFTGAPLEPFFQSDNIHCRLLFPEQGEAPAGSRTRVYTVRAFDRREGWLEIDFLLHAHAGPGGNWARNARVGDHIAVLAPGGRTAPAADWMVLAGDESALPAMARIAENLPPHTRGQFFCELPAEGAVLPVRCPPLMAWTWLFRENTACRSGALLQEAVRQAPLGEGRGSRFLWVGAEFSAAQALRSWAVDTMQLSKHEQLIVAYWRLGMSENELRQPKARH